MKKILVAATAALALATPALAFEVKWGGDFNNRFMYSTQADLARNTALSGEGNAFVNRTDAAILGAIDTKKDSEDSDFFGDLKYRLTLTGTDDDKKVKGVLGFEFGGKRFGQTGNLDFGGDDNIFEFRWGYVDFEVPFDPASHLMVGLMPVGYNKFLWSDNAAGVKWVSKRGNLGYSLGWFRDDVNNLGNGGSTKLENDDAYALDVTYTIEGGPKLNAFGIYLEEGQEGSEITIGTPPVGTGVGTFAGTWDTMDQQIWLGLAGEGQAGALFYGFTGIYLTGEIDAGNGTFAGGETSLDRKAWLANAEVTYKFDKARVKAGWLYSTGDDDPTDGDVENFANIDAYMGGFGSVVVFDSYADDSTLASAPFIQDKGLNMPYVALDFDLNDKASVGVSGLYILTAEDVADEDDLGIEVAARASYKITKNLTTGIEAGYLIGGDLWDELASDGDGDDVFRTDASIRLMF
jgi:hypothetical protein